MLNGIGFFAGLGASYGGHQIANANLHDQTQLRVDHLKDKIEAGNVDPGRLQARLDRRYGEAAAGIVGDDGAVDFERLVDVITEARASHLQDRLDRRFGDAADGIVGSDGTIDIEKLRSLVADKLVEKVEAGDINLHRLERRLTFRFGEDAKSVFNEDGTVDTEALRALITGVDPAQEAAAAGQSADAKLEEIVNGLTGQDGEVDPKKLLEFIIGQLKEKVDSGDLQASDIGNLVTSLFGDAAQGVVGADGSVDFDALQKLISDNGPEALQGFLNAGFGEAAQNIVSADGTIDREALTEFLAGQLNLSADPLATASANDEATETDGANEASDSAGEDTGPGRQFAFGEGGLAELRNLLGLLDERGGFGGFGGFGRHGFGQHHRPFFNFSV